MHDAASLRTFFEEYAEHCSLNPGQALQGLRYIYSHPDIDPIAARGPLALSFRLRSKRIANDLFFAAIPPHWHHTRAALSVMTGARRDDLPADVDKRWDPRCNDRPGPS
jgi:hypothetical protein